MEGAGTVREALASAMPLHAAFPLLAGALALLLGLLCLLAVRAVCVCERGNALARVRLRNERVMATLDMEDCGYDARAATPLPNDASWWEDPDR